MVARSLTSTQYSRRAMKHGASEFRAANTTWNSTLTAAGRIPPALVRQQGSWGPRAPTTPKDLCRRFSPSRYRLKERVPSTAASAPSRPWDRRARCCDGPESAGTRRRLQRVYVRRGTRVREHRMGYRPPKRPTKPSVLLHPPALAREFTANYGEVSRRSDYWSAVALSAKVTPRTRTTTRTSPRRRAPHLPDDFHGSRSAE